MSDEYISRLIRRSIDQNTSPDNAPTPSQIHTIENYFANPRYVDLVYRKLIERADASAKKLEMNILSECVKLLKTSLILYYPSDAVILELDRMCHRFQSKFYNHELFKSISYVRSLIDSISENIHSSQLTKSLSASDVSMEKKKSELKVKYDRPNLTEQKITTDKKRTRHKKSSGSSHGNRKKWRAYYEISMAPNILLSRQKPYATILSTYETFSSSPMFGGQFSMQTLTAYTENNDLFSIKQQDIKERLMAIILSKKNEERQYYRSFRRQSPLFHYKHYKDQYRISLGNKMIEKVVNATMDSQHDNRLVASKILLKLIMDMICQDPTMAPFAIESIMHEMLDSRNEDVRVHALNFLFNLSVHVNMYEEVQFFDSNTEESVGYMNIQKHQEMLYHIVQNVLLSLVYRKETSRKTWFAGMNLLLYFITDKGIISKKLLVGLDPRIICGFLKHIGYISEPVWRHLIRILTNILYLYQSPNTQIPSPEFFSFLCLIGSYNCDKDVINEDAIEGIRFIVELYQQSRSYEAKDNLFCVLFDYLHCCHINRKLQLADEPDSITEEDLNSYRDCFQALTCLDASQQFPALFRYPSPNFLESTNMLIQRILLSNAYFKDILLSIDINMLHKVLNDFYHLALFCSKFDPVNIEAGNALNKLKSMLYSDNDEICKQGERNLFSIMKSIWSQEFGLPMDKMDPKYPQSFLDAVRNMFDEIPKSSQSSVRFIYLKVINQGILLVKSHSNKLPLEEIVNKIFHMVNHYFKKLMDNQEHNEKVLMNMIDILFNLIFVYPMPTREIYCNLSGIIIEKIPTNDYEIHNPNDAEIEGDEEASEIKRLNPRDLFILDQTTSKLQQTLNRRNLNYIQDPIDLAKMDDSIIGGFMKGKVRTSKSLLLKVDIEIFLYIFNILPPRYTSQTRVAILHLIIERCKDRQQDLDAINGTSFFKKLLSENDPQISYLSSRFLIDKLQDEQPDQFHAIINTLLSKAVEVNDEKIISNPYLQIKEILEMNNTLKKKDLL